MTDDELDPTILLGKCWQQGSVFSIMKGSEIDDLSEGTYLVLSQDCDIVNHSYKKEETIEVLRVLKIDSCVSGNLLARQPRLLDIQAVTGNLRAQPNNRQFVSRKKILALTPDYNLDKTNLNILIKWITDRYTRPAFPDAFNNRLASDKFFKKEIIGLLEKGVEALGLLIKVIPNEEIVDTKNYKVQPLLLTEKRDSCSDEMWEKLGEIAWEIRELFSKVKGIEVSNDNMQVIMASDEITYYEVKEFKNWKVDYLSYSNERASGKVICLP